MPDLRTEITEIVTGLGMLGLPTLAYALEQPPLRVQNVEPAQWQRLRQALADRLYSREFEVAWTNGQAFLTAADGLRGRLPAVIEWKGAQRPPAYEQVPADLRIDHVFLVSCKYLSRILFNPSPSHLFDRGLSDRAGDSTVEWYLLAAPEAYQAFYERVRQELALGSLPCHVSTLTALHRLSLKQALSAPRWPTELQEPYREFCRQVASATAQRWSRRLNSRSAGEKMLWRLLRFTGAPYFVLGDSSHGPLQLRVFTPWDWRQKYVLDSFQVMPDEAAGQPQVLWQATVMDKASSLPVQVRGHVEVRWSHGRFGGHPEAKVYLDIPHAHVPGYCALRRN